MKSHLVYLVQELNELSIPLNNFLIIRRFAHVEKTLHEEFSLRIYIELEKILKTT